jgi:hypothetical protein
MDEIGMAVAGMPSASAGTASDIAAAIAALRARGAGAGDPVRLRFVESLARRALAHEGATRRVLDDKLARALHAAGAALERAPSESVEASRAIEDEPPRRGPLGELVDHIARHAPPVASGVGPTTSEREPGGGSPVARDALPFFRRTWSRLSADQRLAQSLSALPENAGPLNSHHLVHRSLVAMRALSPAYFDQFIAHVDALLWLDQAQDAAIAEPAPARVDGERKPARGRRG